MRTDNIDKTELLRHLKIEHEERPDFNWRPGALAFFVLASVLALGVFLLTPSETGLLVTTAVARAAEEQAAERNASVLDASGYVIARRQATVSSKTTGKVSEVLVDEGMYVKEGQLLARLDDTIAVATLKLAESRIEATKSGLGEIHIELAQAQVTLERTRELVSKALVSQAELDASVLSIERLKARIKSVERQVEVSNRQAVLARQQVVDTTVRAPFSGIVIAKAAQPGEIISPVTGGGGFTRTGICTIVDMDSLEVQVDVNEAHLNRIKKDQPVSVRLNAYPDWLIPASVIAIIPTVDRSRAAVRVRIRLLERDERVLPDMGVKASFLSGVPDDEQDPLRRPNMMKPNVIEPSVLVTSVMVPSLAVQQDADGGWSAYVVIDNIVKKRGVRIGKDLGHNKQIIDGLTSGDRVVTNLDARLIAAMSDGAKVRETN